jgi:hypothetical protein
MATAKAIFFELFTENSRNVKVNCASPIEDVGQRLRSRVHLVGAVAHLGQAMSFIYNGARL